MTDDRTMQALAGLATRQVALQAEVAEIEERLRAKKRELAQVAEIEIPEVLEDLGLDEYRTADGVRVKLERGLNVSVAGKYHAPIVAWLREAGHDDIIKHTVNAIFDKGEDAAARELYARLAAEGFRLTEREDVNAQTFKALLRELMADGRPVPLEDLGVSRWRRSKVELPE